MNKIYIKLMLILWACFPIMPVKAYDFEVDGIYYNILSMSDLEVEVTYNTLKHSDTFRYETGNSHYICNRKNESYSGDIIIPSTVNYSNRTFTVVAIGDMAFGIHSNVTHPSGSYYYSTGECIGSDITTVSLPGTIKRIGKDAFSYCKSLTSITFPSSLTSIGDYAFNRSGIEVIDSWGAVESIGEQSFAMCKVAEVYFPSTVKFIGKEAFYGNSLLNRIILPNALDVLEEKVFDNCPLLEVFCTSLRRAEGLNRNSFSGHPALEVYVPSTKVYGFGKEYIITPSGNYMYKGQPYDIDWSNNLKAYKCVVSNLQTAVDAGEHTQYLTATYSGGIDLTVDIPYSYTITPAPMTLKVNDAEREYGEANPGFTCEISGFVNGESEETLGTTPSFQCDATRLSNVGDYRIRASLEAPNYSITYKYGNLSVVKAPMGITVENASRVYGNPNPEFQLSYTGLKNGEIVPLWVSQPKITTEANGYSNVGGYPIYASDANAVNYDIIGYTPGTLSVYKRELTAKANDYERLYDQENPILGISYTGFVNGDTEECFTKQPLAECVADRTSNVGTYPITVTGGEAENYAFVYRDGTLRINPLTVGFKDVYNAVTYMDMAVSTAANKFYYLPEIFGPFSETDFMIQTWALDKDNKYENHQTTITGGEYAGNYVDFPSNGTMWAGKYIFNLVSLGTNPNVVANPSRAYVTVNRTSSNLEWDTQSPILLKEEESLDLGIMYQADQFSVFNLDYDTDIISVTSENPTSSRPHWFVTGLKEGKTSLSFSIECEKNPFGFYNFTDTRTITKRIEILPLSGVDSIDSDGTSYSVKVRNGSIVVENKPETTLVRVFTTQGLCVCETTDSEIDDLAPGIYIVVVNSRATKVLL